MPSQQKHVWLSFHASCRHALLPSRSFMGTVWFSSGLLSAATAGPVTAVPSGGQSDLAIYSLERMSRASEERDIGWG